MITYISFKDKNNTNVFVIKDNDKCMVQRKSLITGKMQSLILPITIEQCIQYYENRQLVQDVFPHLSDGQREFMVSGITPLEWDTHMSDDDDKITDEEYGRMVGIA